LIHRRDRNGSHRDAVQAGRPSAACPTITETNVGPRNQSRRPLDIIGQETKVVLLLTASPPPRPISFTLCYSHTGSLPWNATTEAAQLPLPRQPQPPRLPPNPPLQGPAAMNHNERPHTHQNSNSSNGNDPVTALQIKHRLLHQPLLTNAAPARLQTSCTPPLLTIFGLVRLAKRWASGLPAHQARVASTP
jgi:hypothetical protein